MIDPIFLSLHQTGEYDLALTLVSDHIHSGSELPYCLTILLFGQEYASGGTYSFFSYGCRTGSGTTITAYQHTMEDTARNTLTSTTQDSDSASSSSTTSSKTTSSRSIVEPDSETSSLAATSSAAAAAAVPQDEGLSEGAKIGIGVGTGIFAAVALVAATLLWLRHRSKARARLIQTDTKRYSPELHYHREGSAAGHGPNNPFAGRKAELSCCESNTRAELASSRRCYELDDGKEPQELEGR